MTETDVCLVKLTAVLHAAQHRQVSTLTCDSSDDSCSGCDPCDDCHPEVPLCAGQSWADFNSAQVLTRRKMLAMYGAKRKLFRRDRVRSVLRHIYVELFIVEVLAAS